MTSRSKNLRYGPASESPSWLQRNLIAAPGPIGPAFVAFSLTTFFLVVVLISNPSPNYWKFALLAYVSVGIIGTVVISLLREDKGLTREERMARIVPYTPSLTLVARTWARQRPFLASLVVVVTGIGAVQTTLIVRARGLSAGRAAWLIVEIVVVILLAINLSTAQDADENDADE